MKITLEDFRPSNQGNACRATIKISDIDSAVIDIGTDYELGIYIDGLCHDIGQRLKEECHRIRAISKK